MSAIRCGYAQTPRGQIHYAEAGDGPPLLLLHATPRSHRAFRGMLPLLAPHFRAIAIDAPGYGHSHPLPPEIDMAWMAESLVQCLDALGTDTLDVSDRAIDSHIKNIRRKLTAADASASQCIASVYGVGYRFEILAGGPSVRAA